MLDLLLTDFVPPGIDGGELATTVLASEPTRVVFTSGHLIDDIECGRVGGHGTFLKKPFASNQLLSCVRSELAR